MPFLLYTTLLALTALNTIAGDTVYHLLVVRASAAATIQQEFNTGTHKLAGGIKNLAVPLYLATDTAQTNVVAYWTCLARSQTTAGMRAKFAELRDTLPANAVRLYTFTNTVNTAQVLGSLGLATKRSEITQ